VPRRDSFLTEELEIETNSKAISPDNIEEVYTVAIVTVSVCVRDSCVCVYVCVCVRERGIYSNCFHGASGQEPLTVY
jgi:predicted aminopeptidase